MLKTWKKKGIALLIVVCVLFVGAVGSTLAYLIDRTETVTDVFEPAHVKCAVLKNDNGTYSVKNESNIPVYIRVAVIVNHVDDDNNLTWAGNIHAEIQLYDENKWDAEDDGYYYLKDILNSNDTFVFGKVGADSSLPYQIQLLAEAIQAIPGEAIQNAWISTNDGN